MRDLVRQARELGGFSPDAELCSLMADEIERLREALRRYACGCEIRHCGVSIHECGWVARAALEEKE